MRQASRFVVCQALLVLVSLHVAVHVALADDPPDTSPSGSGSFSTFPVVAGGGQPVQPEQQAKPARGATRTPTRSTQIKSKAQYTRTALQVARSLDPSAEETLQVRTRTGDVATLIVKRRSRNGTSSTAASGPSQPPPYPTRRGAANGTAASRGPKAARPAANVRVPDPVDIFSSTVLVKSQPDSAASPKRARSLLKVDAEGIPVIEGVRVPDDEDDKKYTWRNARVINGKLVPNTPTPTSSRNKAGGADASPASNVSNATASPASSTATSTASPGLPPASTPASLGDAVVKRLSESTAQSPWIPTSPDGANVVAPPLLTQSHAEQQRRILDYIRAVNQLEAGRAASLRGRMLRNNEGPEARVLHYQPALLYSAQSTNPSSRISFEEGARTPVLQYAHPELGVQPAKVAPPPPRNQDRALAYFAQDIHSDRSPFLREPGLDQQEDPVKPVGGAGGASSAKRSSSEATLSAPLVTGVTQRLRKVHPIEDTYGLASDKYIKRFPHASHYKDDYGYRYNGYNSYNSYRADPLYAGYGMSQASPFLEDSRPFWIRLSDSIRDSMQTGMERMSDLARPVVDPLVEASAKISHNLGFTATHGAGGAGGSGGAQDRLGVASAVATPSMLLPALGLVAGGAALGLGAVAVGRYLDVDVMAKRSETQDDDDEEEALEMEHKRALAAMQRGQRYLSGYEQQQQQQHHDGRQVTDADIVAQVAQVVDVVNTQQQQQQQQQHHKQHQSEQAHQRQRRNADAGNTLDSWQLQLAEERRQLALRAAQLGAPTAVWGSTPCAQRVFCDVLTREGPDSALLMEKKMATLLAMLPRVAPEAAAVHLSAVMVAVRRGDCSVFMCPLNSASTSATRPALAPRR